MLQEEMAADKTLGGAPGQTLHALFHGSGSPERLLAQVRKQAQGPVLQLQWEVGSEPGPRSSSPFSFSCHECAG